MVKSLHNKESIVNDESLFSDNLEKDLLKKELVDDLRIDNIEELLFPHKEIRQIQDVLIKKIGECIASRKNLVVHAPTGLGKTAAALSPALTHIVRHNKNVHSNTNNNINSNNINRNNSSSLTIFFLTSRHTQHKIVLDTLRKINDKFKLNILGSSIIGKKHLCLQPGAEGMYSKDFSEFCRLLVDNGKCEYYNNVKSAGRLTVDAEVILNSLKSKAVSSSEQIIRESSSRRVCPYEVSLLLAKESSVIVADYQYIFNPAIRDIFFRKLNKELKDCILIVDEAHNLPSRIKDLSSEFLSTVQLKRAISEAKKYKYNDVASKLESINALLEKYASDLRAYDKEEYSIIKNKFNNTLNNKDSNQSLSKYTNITNYNGSISDEFYSADKYSDKYIRFESSEQYVLKSQFISDVNSIGDYDSLISELVFVSNAIREQQNFSYIGSVAVFLELWRGQDEGFTRILSLKKLKDKSEMITLSYRCLDPSIVSAPVIEKAHSTILMSGTLTPTSMYRELLGIQAEELTLRSPFPSENRLNLIIPKTTTKYESRNPEQYREIAKVLADIVSDVNGSVAIYFPSYYLRDEVSKNFSVLTSKTIFSEQPDMTKSEKQEFLDNFAKYKDSGAILLAVISGSFAEGIDLPGVLKMVIIVGLPLQKPDLETKALIDYYDKKFGKGWDYGYLFPAFTKAIQAAGRCIRNERDKGIIVFLDERYSWNTYYRCFPQHWPLKISFLYKDVIRKFYE